MPVGGRSPRARLQDGTSPVPVKLLADVDPAAFEFRATACALPVGEVAGAVVLRWPPALFALDDPLLGRDVAWLPLELDEE